MKLLPLSLDPSDRVFGRSNLAPPCVVATIQKFVAFVLPNEQRTDMTLPKRHAASMQTTDTLSKVPWCSPKPHSRAPHAQKRPLCYSIPALT